MDSGFHLLDSRSFSVELGFRILIVSGILDSYTCIPDSKTQDSGFHKQKFPTFRIPNAKISRIPESEFLYMGRNFFLLNKCVDQVKNHLKSCNLSRMKVTEYDLILARAGKFNRSHE